MLKLMMINYHKKTSIGSGKYYFWKELETKTNFIYYNIIRQNIQLFPNNNLVNKITSYAFRKCYIPLEIINNHKAIPKTIEKEQPDALIMAERVLKRFGWDFNIKVDIPIIYKTADTHLLLQNLTKFKQFMKNHNVVLLLSRMKYLISLLSTFKFHCKILWLPFSVNTKIFKNYSEKKYDVISTGRRSYAYPLREKIRQKLSKSKDIKYFYPKYPNISFLAGVKGFAYDNYAKLLSSAKIFIFGTGIYNYPIQKYFEGMSSSCMVIAPIPKDAKELHFIPNYNFIELNKKTYIQDIEYYLNNESERQKIVRNANETIKKYHTVEKSVNRLVNVMEKIL